MSFKRRDMIKSGLVVAGAISGGALTTTTATAQKHPQSKTDCYDVVVLGAGLAGLCAAVEAKEKGANVVLLEKMGYANGTTVYATGWVSGVNSKVYQQQYTDDSEEQMVDDMMKLSLGRADREVLRAYAREAGPGVDWLHEMGVPFKVWPLHAPERNRVMIAQGNGISGGAIMVQKLIEKCKKIGIPIHYNTKAYKLITNDKMEVLGVTCMTKDGSVDYMAKGGVIIATGGFAANPEMVCKYIGPWGTRLVLRGSPYITGENIIMGQQVMAYMECMDEYYAGPMTPTGHANPSPMMHGGYGIQLNSQGKRFLMEHLGQVAKAVTLAKETPDNRSYVLLASDTDDNNNILTNTLNRFKRLGIEVPKGNTIEEVAKNAGLPVETVTASVNEFNAAAKASTADKLTPPYLWKPAHPIEKGPFYIFPAAGGIAATFGGPKTNGKAQVVNFEKQPIPGLYAAGNAAGGLWFHEEISGNQLGACIAFGRISGREATARAKKA